MKFFSAALSAATIGSALASPILGSACGGHGAVPSGLPSGAASPINAGDLVPSQVEALTSATTLTWATTISDSKTQYYTNPADILPTGVPSAPSTGLDAGKIGSGATSGKAPAVVVKEVTTIVLNIDVLVKADLARITELVDCKTGVDVQLLLEAIVSLSGHLNLLVTGIVPELTALIRPSVGLVGAELQIVLDLVADIEVLIGQVQVCLKHLVANVSASVLVAVSAQLQIIHKLIVHNLVAVVVKFALSVVAGVSANLKVVADIHAHVNALHSCAGGLSVFLGAALKVVL